MLPHCSCTFILGPVYGMSENVFFFCVWIRQAKSLRFLYFSHSIHSIIIFFFFVWFSLHVCSFVNWGWRCFVIVLPARLRFSGHCVCCWVVVGSYVSATASSVREKLLNDYQPVAHQKGFPKITHRNTSMPNLFIQFVWVIHINIFLFGCCCCSPKNARAQKEKKARKTPWQN